MDGINNEELVSDWEFRTYMFGSLVAVVLTIAFELDLSPQLIGNDKLFKS